MAFRRGKHRKPETSNVQSPTLSSMHSLSLVLLVTMARLEPGDVCRLKDAGNSTQNTVSYSENGINKHGAERGDWVGTVILRYSPGCARCLLFTAWWRGHKRWQLPVRDDSITRIKHVRFIMGHGWHCSARPYSVALAPAVAASGLICALL